MSFQEISPFPMLSVLLAENSTLFFTPVSRWRSYHRAFSRRDPVLLAQKLSESLSGKEGRSSSVGIFPLFFAYEVRSLCKKDREGMG